MKTHNQLFIEELARKEAECIKTAARIIKSLEVVMKEAVDKGRITSKGGVFEWNYYSIDDNFLRIIKVYLRKHGWDCSYAPRTETCWSMTAKDYHDYTVHEFRLRPCR